MVAPEAVIHVGVDFGTTNTVICVCDSTGTTATLQFPSQQGSLSTFRSVICYVQDEVDDHSAKTRVFCGPAAIEAFLLYGEQARLIQSVKTFLSSRTFSASQIHGREYTLEKILADFLDGLLNELREIELVSDSPEKIHWLRLFLERELGFHLYQAVNACKSALSASDQAELTFCFPPIDIRCTVRRSDFEHWIERDVAAIESSCSEALAAAGLVEEDISVVFMTGGTSFVPLIRDRFKLRFGKEKIVSGDEFVSVGSGLALLAHDRARH